MKVEIVELQICSDLSICRSIIMKQFTSVSTW